MPSKNLSEKVLENKEKSGKKMDKRLVQFYRDHYDRSTRRSAQLRES